MLLWIMKTLGIFEYHICIQMSTLKWDCTIFGSPILSEIRFDSHISSQIRWNKSIKHKTNHISSQIWFEYKHSNIILITYILSRIKPNTNLITFHSSQKKYNQPNVITITSHLKLFVNSDLISIQTLKICSNVINKYSFVALVFSN